MRKEKCRNDVHHGDCGDWDTRGWRIAWMSTTSWFSRSGFAALAAALGCLPAASLNGAETDAAAGPKTGSVQGIVTFHGEVPLSRLVDQTANQRPLLAVNSKTRGAQYVLAFVDIEPPAATNSRLAATGELPAPVIDQRNDTFEPHLIAIRSGQVVKFTNHDFANHNVHAFSPVATNAFNVFTGVGGEYQHRFVADTQGRPVRLACDIHAWMGGWIYVFDHPFHAVTDGNGKFRITGIPAGEYTLVFKQPDVAFSEQRTIKVSAGQTNDVKVEINREALKVR
jgi:plastocyanin